MEDYGTVFRTKQLTILGVSIGIIITARYSFIDGGVKGHIVLTDISTMKITILSEIAIPNGKIIDVKNVLNTMFDSLTVT